MAPIGITRYPLPGKARFCIAPRDMPKHFSLCRMITNLVSVTRKLSLRVLSSCVPKDKSKPLAIRFWRTAGFEPAKYELTRLKAQAFFWHTLWNILVHRCERSIQTHAPSNLASIFYYSIYCLSRKKSCELRNFHSRVRKYICFLILFTNFSRNCSGETTFSTWPKDNTRIKSSVSSSFS